MEIEKEKRKKAVKNNESFEENIENIDEIILRLESGELTLEDSIQEYEKAMTLLKKTNEILNAAQGKILKVTEDNDNLVLEEV